MTELELFEAALECSPDQRSDFLDAKCVGNPPLRKRLDALLARHQQAESFLEIPATELIVRSEPATQRQGQIIAGRYKLLEQIGEGGMGTVWVAEQIESVKRRVALKLIKPGMDTKQVLSRFEAERQALALMDHPNIARVFDGGMTDEGRPFFVMEYVKGLPLIQYCDDAKLTVVDRLALFMQICQAVQHAHQKGIIHRDLKPSNILVCLYDGQPVPKVIDFGLAKAMHQSLTEQTLYTAHGLMVGTPLYMSPEQAEFNNLDIDTRSDIYSLGVILYELLTGTTPLEKRQFKDAAFQEIVRLIKEEEPPRPSTRLSGSGSLPALAAQRSLEPAKLTKTVRGELDWIVMKALEKDRSRRYETASGLARDVQRYLSDESVEACPPSSSYRLRKFARRNVRALSTAALVGVMLLVAVGAVGGSLGWMARDKEARQAKLAGQLELIMEEVTQREAEQEWPEALAAAQRAEALLAGGGGDANLGRQLRDVLADLTLIEQLESIRLETIDDQGTIEWAGRSYAKALREIGVDLDEMTADEAAQRLRTRKHLTPIWGTTLDDWSRRRYLTGDAAGARVVAAVAERLDPDPWRQRIRDVLGGVDESAFASALFSAGTMDERTIAALEDLAASPDLDRQPPASLFHLGLTLTDMARKPEQGAAVLRIAHERYPADFWINTGLALSLAGMGPDHQDEALGFNWAALALRPNDAFAWYRIGVIRQYHHKDLDKANFCYRKALVFGPNHTWVQSGVGQAFLHQNKYDEALVCIHKSLELDPSYAPAYTHLGDVLRAQKRLDEAVATYRKAIEINPKNSGSYYGLGLILLEQNKVDEAVDLVSKGVDHNPKNASFWWVLGRALHKQKKLDEAVAAFHKALAIDSKPATYHWGLAFTLRDQKKTDEAVAAFRKAVALDPKQAYATYGLGLALMDQKQPEEAIAVFRKTIELEPTRADAHQKLGNLLAEQGQVAEAIPCYRKAIELDPKSPWSRGNLAWHLATAADLDLRDPLAALEHARIATELQPASPIFWHNLGVALLRTGDAHAAVQMLEKSNQMAAPGDQRHFFLAMAYWQHGEQDQARQAYGQAVQWMDQHQPDNEALRRIRAEVAELLGIAEPDVTKVP